MPAFSPLFPHSGIQCEKCGLKRGLDRPKEARVAESNNYGCHFEFAGGRNGEAVASRKRRTYDADSRTFRKRAL